MSRDAAIAANRFGLGARPGEIARLDEPREWLLRQVTSEASPVESMSDLGRSDAVLAEVYAARQRRNARRRAGEEIGNEYARTVRRHYAAQLLARYREAAKTPQPFRERLVHFFSNHFAVSVDKQPLSAVAGLFENEAIRPNVTGRFADLLVAVEQHPAMLTYLDNQRSIGPGSRLGKMAGRRRPDQQVGLNENLAREILELHTLGVDGGYTQDDVTSLAKVITGWSIAGERDLRRDDRLSMGAFHYRSFAHEPGTQTVLGNRYRDRGLEQGINVLNDLAVHPATARNISLKLARHFVADDPDPGLVDALTKTWLDTDGDLAAVSQTLVGHDASWSESAQKYKTPHDYLVSTYRALDATPERPQNLFTSLEQLGQPAWAPGSPAGWPDTADDWGSPDGLFKRIEWAGGVSRLAGKQLKPLSLADDVLGDTLTTQTRRTVSRAESAEQGLALLFASPDFLRR